MTPSFPPYEVSLSDLSDDFIFGIAFSGYLGYAWRDVMNFMTVCKRFRNIGFKYIGMFICRETQQIQDLPTLFSHFSSIVYFNASFFTFIDKTILDSMQHWKNSLKGLNFRGSSINSEELQYLFRSNEELLQNLVSLDISKDARNKRDAITDHGLAYIPKLSSLKWLNVACTNITDATLLSITGHLHHLEYLNLQACPLITNNGVKTLQQLPLRSLDISGCLLLSAAIFKTLFDDNFIREFNESYISLFLTAPRLRRLDCRTARNTEISPELVDAAKKQLTAPIFRHQDQCNYLRGSETGVIPLEVDYSDLWPLCMWPYEE